MKKIFMTVLILVIGFAAHIAAEVPSLLSYQGVLADAGGVAVADGPYRITFSIYDVREGGAALWTELDTVSVSKGIFNAVLGRWASLGGLDFDGTYYLGVSIDGGAELVPRALITASAYSLNANAVKGSTNVFPSSGRVGIGTANPGQPLHVVDNSGGQVGILLDGNDDWWASMYVNALKATAQPTYGYERLSTLKATTFVDPSDSWHLAVGGNNAIVASSAGNVCIGGTNPTEKLRVDGGILLGNTSNTAAGTMRWSGADFEGYDGSSWKSFTTTGGGSLPAGALGQTLRHNGLNWAAVSNLYNDGARIGIGTTAPATDLHIFRNEDATVGIAIANPNTGENSTQRIDFQDENGSLAALAIFDNDNASYPSEMHLFNNRPGGSLELSGGSGFVSIRNSGNVGVDIETPNATLQVKGGNVDLQATEGDLKIGDDTYRLKFGVATEGPEAGVSRICASGGQQKLILTAGVSDVLTLGPSAVDIGSSTSSGQLRLFNSGIATRVLGAGTSNQGGSLTIYDEADNRTVSLQADPDGTGGYLEIHRNINQVGFWVDGNAFGTNEPQVAVIGSYQSVFFDMDQSGTSTVMLPSASIGAPEIADEPGAVTYTEGVATITLFSTISTIGSQTITAPAAGYVLVIASGQFEITHTNGTLTDAIVGVSANSAALPGNQDIRILLQPGMPSGLYAFPAGAHAVFSVSAGANTFYFLGREDFGDVRLYDIQLTCLYIPTAYGTVEPPAVSTGASSDAGAAIRPAIDVAAQRAASEAANTARMQRELDEMRAELDAVKAKLENK